MLLRLLRFFPLFVTLACFAAAPDGAALYSSVDAASA
jgi:hypothetical protein